MLNAECSDINLPGCCGEDKVVLQHSVLSAALHDLARLDIDILPGQILYLQLIDGAGFVDNNLVLLHRLGQGQVPILDALLSVNEVDVQVVVLIRAAEPQLGGARSDRGRQKGSDIDCGGSHGDFSSARKCRHGATPFSRESSANAPDFS